MTKRLLSCKRLKHMINYLEIMNCTQTVSGRATMEVVKIILIVLIGLNLLSTGVITKV